MRGANEPDLDLFLGIVKKGNNFHRRDFLKLGYTPRQYWFAVKKLKDNEYILQDGNKCSFAINYDRVGGEEIISNIKTSYDIFRTHGRLWKAANKGFLINNH